MKNNFRVLNNVPRTKLIISVIKILITIKIYNINDNIYLCLFSFPGWYNIRRTNLEHNFPLCNISQLGKQKFLQTYNKYGFFDISFLFLSEFNFVQFLIDIKSRDFKVFPTVYLAIHRNILSKSIRLIAVVKKGT